MSALTPDQIRMRERFESVIRVAAPALNLMLAAGDRISRLVEPEDPDYYPPRSARVEPRPPTASERAE